MVQQYFISSLVFFILSSSLCSAASSGGFQYPGDKGPDLSIPWVIGDFKPLAWFSALTDYNVTLWQQDPPSLVGTSDGNGVGDKDYLWQVQTYNADTSVSSRYTLWGGYEIYHNASSGFVSYSFNVTNEAPASLTSSAAATSSAATSSSASTASPTPSSGASSGGNDTTNSQASSNDSSNDSLKIGLGVGLGVGIPLVIGLGVLIGWVLFRRRGGSSKDDKQHQFAADAQGFDGAVGHRGFGSQQYPPEYKVNETSPSPVQQAQRPDPPPAELGAGRGMSELSA